MPARRTALRQLFSKGQVTDTDTADLTPDQAEALRDCVWTSNGDIAKRGAFLHASEANPLDGWTNKLTGAILVPDVDTAPQTYSIVAGDYGGRLGKLAAYNYQPVSPNIIGNTSDTETVAQQLPVYPLLAYQGEVIAAVVNRNALDDANYDGPLIRWAGSTATETAAPAGTVAVTAGSDVIVGTGTAFTSVCNVGQYLVTRDANYIRYYGLVVKIESDTRLRVSAPADISMSGNAYFTVNQGIIGLGSLVTTQGRASAAAGTITGEATSWNSTLGKVSSQVDRISNEAGAAMYLITAVTDDDTLSATGAPTFSSGGYRITRPLSGQMVTLHQNRLWVAGLPWAPNRLQVTPVAFSLSSFFNGVDSSTTAPGVANVTESVEIPSPYDPGRIIALEAGNDPGPLLVLRDRDAYIVYGEWPSVQVTKLGDNIGCVHQFASCSSEHGFIWAGSDGVYQYRPGGGVRDLTEGKINREWRAHIRSVAAYPNFQVSVEVVDSYLVISSAYGSTFDSAGAAQPPDTFPSTQYVLDIERGAWGTWTGPNVLGMSAFFFGGQPRDVIATDYATNRLITLSGATIPTLAGSSDGVNGTFLARSGRMLMGSAGDLGRVVDSRVTYRLQGSSPQFTVKFGSTTLNTAATVTTTTATSAYATTRVKPGSTNLGTQGRDMQVEFAESSGTPTRLEINEFSWVTRERRKRA